MSSGNAIVSLQKAKKKSFHLRVEEAASTTSGRSSGGRGENVDGTGASTGMEYISHHMLIPPLDDHRDNLDAYLERCEYVAVGQKWPEWWAPTLCL